jgi:hypothetical protein
VVNGEAAASPGRETAVVLEVAIRPGDGQDRFTVEVVRSPAGVASADVELPVGALLARRSELQAALLGWPLSGGRPPLSGGGGPAAARPADPFLEVGRTLFTALLGTGEVAARYRASAALATDRELGLRIVLRIGSAELGGLPWEAMHDEATGAYVCRRHQLVRHVPVPVAVRPLMVRPPLRILGVVSAPPRLVALDVGAERDLLTTALAPLVSAGLAELAWASSATWEELHRLLMAEPWHVLHYIGHGDFHADVDEGVLVLTEASGQPDLIEASRFTDLLHQARPMPRLVFLNCCSGGAAGSRSLFAGTATALARAGVPAVAAMQFEITDQAAAAFAHGFYTAIASGRGVDDAVSAGRISILGTRRGTMEWVTPVLYSQDPQAQLFTRPIGTDAQTGAPGHAGAQTPPKAAPQAQAEGQAPASPPPPASAGHAFISYAAQDSLPADRLQELLEGAGIPVWRDTDNLWAGEDWRTNIRRAISRDALVFLACFSRGRNAEAKGRHHEELVLAIDELRLRRPDRPWLIPVRFDDCQVPDLHIGGSRSLNDIQPADLFGDRYERNAHRLTQAIQRILRQDATAG